MSHLSYLATIWHMVFLGWGISSKSCVKLLISLIFCGLLRCRSCMMAHVLCVSWNHRSDWFLTSEAEVEGLHGTRRQQHFLPFPWFTFLYIEVPMLKLHVVPVVLNASVVCLARSRGQSPNRTSDHAEVHSPLFWMQGLCSAFWRNG